MSMKDLFKLSSFKRQIKVFNYLYVGQQKSLKGFVWKIYFMVYDKNLVEKLTIKFYLKI